MKSSHLVDWSTYVPHSRAVLCFLVKDGSVLLMRKKRGLGAGKINGPGGKLESGERPVDAAIRETEEEVGLRPVDPVHYGTLRFAFVDGLHLEAQIFVAYRWTGRLRETDEAEPFWIDMDRIPFEQMWEDDRLWLPRVLSGRHVEAEMTFDTDTLLWWDMRFCDGTRSIPDDGAA